MAGGVRCQRDLDVDPYIDTRCERPDSMWDTTLALIAYALAADDFPAIAARYSQFAQYSIRPSRFVSFSSR